MQKEKYRRVLNTMWGADGIGHRLYRHAVRVRITRDHGLHRLHGRLIRIMMWKPRQILQWSRYRLVTRTHTSTRSPTPWRDCTHSPRNPGWDIKHRLSLY